MSTQLPLRLARPHDNQQLFADHYLDVILPQRAEWRALADEAAQAQADLRAIFARFTPSAIEAQTEDDLIKPVLARLGHTVEVQAALRTPRGTRKPDYVFYRDAAARAANKDQTLTPELLQGRAFAVGDAKHWDRPLDVSLRVRSGDPELNRIPSDQLAFYMLHGRVTWGILTNGRRWRLYHADTAQQQDRYYEVDLEALTLHGTAEDFCYFYAFFRRPAFDDGPLGLAALLQESRAAARAIGDNLRRQVYDALRHLAQGFLDYRANQLTPDPATLKQIYDQSLTILYRLLFILYAEARELLPLRESAAYRRDYSLTALAREVADRIDSQRELLPTGSRLWARLRDLFTIIHEGSPPLLVATFNGGLFDPQRHPFLVQYTVGDARLAHALDLLTRIDREQIDYRDLAERHLGTIYEGLLEYHLTPIEPAPHPPAPLLPLRGDAGAPHPPAPLLPLRGEGGTQLNQPPIPPLPRSWERGTGGEGIPPTSPPGAGGEGGGEGIPPTSPSLPLLPHSQLRGSGGAEADRWNVPAAMKQRMTEVARGFRKTPTQGEAILWEALRNRKLEGRKFRRQETLGPFVVDFLCTEERLIVEVDGPIHEQQRAADQARQALLEALGFRFVRIPNSLVLQNLIQALDIIRQALTVSPHPPDPLLPLPGEGDAQLLQSPLPPLPAAWERGLGGEGIPPTSESTWTIDIVNDRGERHRTGSYYTPDFVVQYLVEQAVGPALQHAAARATSDAERAAAILAVNVCDPAMGSGHFLVAATEYIARFLVELGVPAEADVQDEADLAYWKRRVAQNCIYGVDLNPLAVDLAKLSLWLATAAKGRPLSFLDHHLRCGNALVGLRIAELDTPPARTHNSGNTSRKRGRMPDPADAMQHSMLDDPAFAGAMSTAVGSMWLIEAQHGNTIAEVREQEALYERVRADLTRRYQTLADIATAAAFGVTLDPALRRPLADYATNRDQGMFATPAFEPLLTAVRTAAQQQRFFHWDLEFPEVFFDRHGRPLGDEAGFDAVIGNPPYVRQELLAPLKPYVAAAYADVAAGTADLYVYFVRNGLRLLQRNGRLAYIASNSWLRANYAGPLRAFLRSNATVEQLIDLGDNRVFADAPDVYPALLIARPDPPPETYLAQAAIFNRGEGVQDFANRIEAKLQPVSMHDQRDSGWQLGDDAGRRVFTKIMRIGIPLDTVINGNLYYGIKTGLNDAYIINTQIYNEITRKDNTNSNILLRKIMRAEDLRPWYQEDENRWLILIPNGWTSVRYGTGLSEIQAWKQFSEEFTGIANHLLSFGDGIRNRGDKGEYWWELRPCAYLSDFDKPKILSAEIGKIPRYSWDNLGLFVNNKAHLMPCDDPWLLGILQSRTLWFITSQICTPLGERAGSIRYQQLLQFISQLPIPDASAADQTLIGDLAMQISAQARARYQVHQRARRRILADLGSAGRTLNQKLTAWWTLDFPTFRNEVKGALKREIAVRERDDWEEWLGMQRERHTQHTAEIIRLETELNGHVYRLFDLDRNEIALIETATKYTYGEV